MRPHVHLDVTNQTNPNHGLPTHDMNGNQIFWKNFVPNVKKEATMKGYMRDMGLVDDEFDFYKWEAWSKKRITHINKKGEEVKIYPNQNAARDFIGWYAADPKKIANFHRMAGTKSPEELILILSIA